MQPFVSIIIPTFNRVHLIGETLESVLAQTFQNWECIVVDDGSTDKTAKLLEFYCEKDSRIKYLEKPQAYPKGANACRNYGLDLSIGDFINWFDDDDIMHPQKLERQLAFLKNSNYNFSICQTSVFDDKTNKVLGLRNSLLTSDQVFFDYLRMRIGWLTQAPLWKKNFLTQNNFRFDEELHAAQEWEFHCRILNKFPKYNKIDDSLVLIRKHEHSITYNPSSRYRSWYYFLARLKIYKNSELILDDSSTKFLRNYLLNSFKSMIIAKNVNVINAYKMFILTEKEISNFSKINAFLAIIAFKVFNKGNYVLQNIKYK